MNIRDSVAFVTGANRGIGLTFMQELLAALGAKGLCRGAESGKHSHSQGGGAGSS